MSKNLNSFRHFLSIGGICFGLVFMGDLSTVQAQAYLAHGITLSSQAEMDAFPTNFPGCRIMLGELRIQEDSQGVIRNLANPVRL